MLKKFIANKRSISFIMSLCVIACFVFTPFLGIKTYSAPALDIESGNFQKTDVNNTLKGETNLIYNREFTKVYQYDNGTTNTTAYNGGANKKKYTDGDLSTSEQLNGKIYYNTDGTVKNTAPYDNPKHYTDVTYRFEDNADVNEIWVYHHTNSALVGYVYQLYLSDDESTLYNAESLITTYTNTDCESYQKFKFGEAIQNKKYFGIRFLVATPTNTNLGAFVRLTELAVIGELKPLGVSVDSGNFQKTDSVPELKEETNLIYDKEITKVFQYDNGTTNTTAYNGGANKKKYTDGDLATSEQLNGKIYYNTDDTPKNNFPYTNPIYYTDLTYTFSDNANVSEIWVYHHTNSALVGYVYQLYLSDSLDTLYTEENLVTTYKNADCESYQKFKFKEKYNNKQYFGIRFLVPTPTNTSLGAMVRLTELAVIGEYAPLSNEIIVSEDYTKEDKISHNLKTPGNLIYGRKYEEVYQNNNGTDTSTEAAAQIKNSPNILTDGNIATNTFLPGRIYFDETSHTPNNTAPYTNPKYYTDLTYSFEDKAEVSSIWVYNHSTEELANYVYELYLSDSKDTLYTEASRVITYVNENLDGVQKFSFRTPYTNKKYLGVRFIMPTKEFSSNGSVVRISELAVMGTIAAPEATISTGTHASTDTVAELKGESNILYGKELTSVLHNNNGTVNSTAVSATDKPKFTDGELSTIGQANGAIYYKDDSTPNNVAPYLSPNYYTDLVYSLDGKAEVSEIWVYNHHNSHLATYAYQLFLSDSLDGLFTTSSLVATYENTNGSTYQKFAFAEKLENKRYFGIRFLNPVPVDSTYTGGARYVRLTELAVIGNVVAEPVRIYSDNYTQNANDSELKTNNNLLYNKKYNQIIQFNNGDYSGSVGAETDLKANPTAITDGGTDNSVRLLNQIYYNADKTPKNTEPYTDPKYYTTLTYFLGGSSTVNEVWVYNHHNPELTTKVYQLYMSDNRGALYDEASLVATYVNENNDTRQKFTFPEALTGKQYVGIKFLVSAPENTSYTVNTLYLRIAQLAVFGTVDTVTEEDKSAFNPEKEFYESLYRRYDMNLIKGKTPQIYANSGTGDLQISPNDVSRINDEANDNGFFTGTPRFAEYLSDTKILYYKDGTDHYLKLQYNLGTICEIKHIVLAHHSNEELRTHSYEIYVANDKADLWKEENRIEDHVNAGREQCEEFEYTTPKVGKYIGLKIKYPVSESVVPNKTANLVYTRINEFAVFGNYQDPNYTPPASNAIGELSDTDLAALGTSLISGKRPTIRFDGTPMSKSHYGGKDAQFTDGIMYPHADVTSPTSGTGKLITTDGSSHLDVIYDWEEVKYDITGFLYAGVANVASTQYYTGWYQVFIAEEYDDLFLEENMVFEYNWEEELFERGHYVNFDTPKRGAYFAIRILNPVSGATEYIAPRISEIAVYGKKAKIVVKPINLISNMPIEAYTESESGKLEEISETNLTVKEVKNLTDNNTSTKATIKTSKKVQILYNLCSDSVINTFKLTSNAKKYKVYASEDLNEIWNDDSLVYTYNGKGTNGKTFKKGKKIRYVRFEISNFGSELKISEIECIGGDDQLLKYKKLSRTFEAKQLSLSYYNYETGNYDYLFSNINGSVGKLFDSGYLSPVGFYGGKSGEEALDLVIVLDDVRNIDNIAISFPKVLPGYSPTKFEIYTSEVLSEFNFGEFDVEPTVSYDGEPVLGTYNVSFRPRLARAILIRFIEGAPNYDPYQNGSITMGITELEVSGTPVKGMQKDEYSDSLLTFKDKKTGVIVDILKYDKNDIYTRAHSLKVEKVTATREQKRNLASQGALKIINDVVYDISLLDVNGKELTDIDGRMVRITLPCDVAKHGYPLVAQAIKNEVTAVEATSEPTRTYIEVESLEDANYLVASYVSADDPYFEDLDVEVPENIYNPSYPQYEDMGNNEYYDDFQGTASPETGEGAPTAALILFVSAAGLFVVSRKKPV